MGDFFNYVAPEESDVEQFESNSLRLTDGGYNEDISAYCFYAKRNYARGDQVLLHILCPKTKYFLETSERKEEEATPICKRNLWLCFEEATPILFRDNCGTMYRIL